MEIKIPKEVRAHKEALFFGLTIRQFVCAVLAVGVAVAVYLGLQAVTDKDTASWVCIVAAVPFAAAGFFHYNGLTFEQFIVAYVKSQFLCAGPRVFKAENIYCRALSRKGAAYDA